jgi:hypothetical protein
VVLGRDGRSKRRRVLLQQMEGGEQSGTADLLKNGLLTPTLPQLLLGALIHCSSSRFPILMLDAQFATTSTSTPTTTLKDTSPLPPFSLSRSPPPAEREPLHLPRLKRPGPHEGFREEELNILVVPILSWEGLEEDDDGLLKQQWEESESRREGEAVERRGRWSD